MRRSALKAYKPLRRTPLRSRSTKQPNKSRIDYSQFPLAKQEKPVPVLWEYAEGKIVYNLRHPQGEHLYRCAISAMWKRQGERCSIGGEYIPVALATFEHGAGRNKNRQDDRIDTVDAEGFYVNSAACREHNCKKGSRRNYPLAIRIRKETA